MARPMVAALALTGAIFWSGPISAGEIPEDAEPERTFWHAVMMACWPEKEQPGGPLPCLTDKETFATEEACHLGNERLAMSLILQGSYSHTLPVIECIPFTLPTPGQPL